MKIGISACLLGDNVRYDGSNKYNKQIAKLLENHEIIKICPELASGFPIPRQAMEISNSKVYTKDGKDLTEELLKGSIKCFEQIKDCDFLILKTKSVSCGYQKVYDGTFTNTLIDGNGIFTDLCLKNNILVFSENEIEKIKEKLR